MEDTEPTGAEFATKLGDLIEEHMNLPPLLILKVMAGVMEDFRALNTRLEIAAAFEALNKGLVEATGKKSGIVKP